MGCLWHGYTDQRYTDQTNFDPALMCKGWGNGATARWNNRDATGTALPDTTGGRACERLWRPCLITPRCRRVATIWRHCERAADALHYDRRPPLTVIR